MNLRVLSSEWYSCMMLRGYILYLLTSLSKCSYYKSYNCCVDKTLKKAQHFDFRNKPNRQKPTGCHLSSLYSVPFCHFRKFV